MVRSVKPIRPDEAGKKKRQQQIDNIPDFVIDVVNDLIIKNYSERSKTSKFKQDDILDVIVLKGLATREEMFEKKWLDIEPLFKSFGWEVSYDKPAYCETYPATFTFKRV